MIEINAPGWGKREIEHLVLDFNGTLAMDGRLIPPWWRRCWLPARTARSMDKEPGSRVTLPSPTSISGLLRKR